MIQAKRRSKSKVIRRASGISLTELMVGAILLGVSVGVVAELMALCVYANTTLFRQFDAQTGCNFALERIKRDTRMATRIRSALTPEEQTEFGSKKNLNAQTLILQLPIRFLSKINDPNSGVYDSGAAAASGTGFDIPGHYVVIYEVVPSADRAGEFDMVMSRRRLPNETVYRANFAELSEENSFLSNITQQVIAKGIVGPLESGAASGFPKVFSYVAKRPGSVGNAGRLDILKEAYLSIDSVSDGASGVSVDMEIRRGNENIQLKDNEQVIATHSECFIRLKNDFVGPSDLNVYE